MPHPYATDSNERKNVIVFLVLLALRAAMQTPIDQVAANDRRRIAFDALHGYSVTAMGVALLAGLLAFLIMARPKVFLQGTLPKGQVLRLLGECFLYAFNQLSNRTKVGGSIT